MDIDFDEYYSRHFPLRSIGKDNQLKLQAKKVLVAGMGGLGSASAALLASLGVGYLRIVDFDVVEISNLPRQTIYRVEDVGKAKVEVAAKRLEERNPFIKIDVQPTRIDAISANSLLEGIDVVVDGLDLFSSRRALFRAARQLKIPYVFCGSVAEQANLMSFTHGDGKPCLECVLGDVGDEASQSCEVLGVNPAILQIATSIQVNEAVRILLDQELNLDGKMMYIDLPSLDFDKIQFNKRNDCKLCGQTNAVEDQLDKGKPGETTKGVREIGNFGHALVTSLCGRDTRIIDPSWEIVWDFEKIKGILKTKWFLAVEGENYATFNVEGVGISLLSSGVATIRGAQTTFNAIQTYTIVYDYIDEILVST